MTSQLILKDSDDIKNALFETMAAGLRFPSVISVRVYHTSDFKSCKDSTPVLLAYLRLVLISYVSFIGSSLPFLPCISRTELTKRIFQVSMLEGKLSNYTIKNSEMEKRITVLSKKEEEGILTDKLLNDANQDLKGYQFCPTRYFESLNSSLSCWHRFQILNLGWSKFYGMARLERNFSSVAVIQPFDFSDLL